MYTPVSVKVVFGFWSTQNTTMKCCLSDHQTIALKDQSMIPKATFIEIGVYRKNRDGQAY